MEDYKTMYEQALDNFKKIRAANKDNKELVDFIEYNYPELKENKDEEKPNGGIVSEDFNEGEGFYKVNLAYLNKEQVIEIEELVKKWNPELKEREDKIMKELILNVLLSTTPQLEEILSIYKKRREDVIAWLEKQSEPQVRTGSEWVKTIDAACEHRYAEEYAYGEHCHQQSFRWGFQEGVDWLEKQGEQSHCNGEVNDEALQRQLQIWFDKGKCSGRDEVIFHPENFGLQKQGEQKPVEWHREDEQNLNVCLGYIPDEFLRRWLKDVVHEKYDKPTWSEEDEQRIESAIEHLENSISDTPSSLRPYVRKDIDWLKSLKDRVGN